jgi:hypothetical protein
MLSAMLAAALSACAAAPVISRPASACSTLIPDAWRQGVPSANPPEQDTAGLWIAFGDAQTGQLDKANSRTVDSIEIVEKCERRDAEAIKLIEGRTVWQKLTPWRE